MHALPGGPVPKSGGKALSAVKADKAAKVAGWLVGGLYDHYIQENRWNIGRIIYWYFTDLYCVLKKWRNYVYINVKDYRWY